ncbi:hypothetical protein I4U23_008122 [Adineta vaga]|nr:hypothetical protein I4U23_008122 [Adineta vaga]
MITSGIRNIIQFFCILILFNMIAAVYLNPREHRHPYVYNNQRSADSGYRYAWFTRDIHDDPDRDDGNNSLEQQREQQLSPQETLRLKTPKSIFNRQYQNNDETMVESNENR